MLKQLVLFTSLFFACSPEQNIPVPEAYSFRFEEYSIAQLHAGYTNGDFTVEEVVQSYLDRIDAIDKEGPKLNSIIQINPEALKIAKQLDEKFQAGQLKGPLHGIPVVLKDNIDTHDQMATTAGSRALLRSHPPKDSYVAKKLRESGAVILGKSNLSEWSLFPPDLSCCGWSAYGGQTKNPYKLDRTPCGSSSGSGVAVSANFCVLSIGVETNGSIVCPAATNGIVGIKPTVGLLSRSGIVPITITHDTPGPIARSVEDAAISLGALVGIDSADSKTLLSQGKSFQDYTQFLKADGLSGKRIGRYKKPFSLYSEVDELMEQAVDYMISQGVEIVEIEKITVPKSVKPGLIMLYELKHGLNKYFASLGDQSPVKDVKELIAFNETDSLELKYFDRQNVLKKAQEKGTLDSPEYKEAITNMLTAMRQQGIDLVMDEHNLDAIIAPTGGPAPRTGKVKGNNFLRSSSSSLMASSSAAAYAGYPNITVPMGSVDGLPVGISFFGRAWSEPVLLEIAYAYEQGTKHRMVPKFLEH